MMKIYKHQQDLINKNPNKWLLAWSTGTGKTLTVIKLAENKNGNTLVIVPKSLVDNWHRELKRWAVNPEAFRIITKETFRRDYKKIPVYPTIIVDEAHHFSGYKSQMHKSLKAYIKVHKTENVFLLTATPYRSTPFNIMALGNLLGKDWSWYSWDKKFFNSFPMGRIKIKKLKTEVDGKPVEDVIANIINNSLGNTVSMKDVIDVPEHTFIREDFTATAEQRKAIKELDDATPIARMGKTFQILNGTLKSDGYIEDQYYKCDKFKRALEIIDENKKIAVVCRHTLELQRFKEEIKNRKVFVLSGSTPQEDRDAMIQDFNNSEDCVILINSKVSEGYSLYTPVMMFYSMDWGLVEYTQMIGRPVRLDHLKSIVYINLIYPKTIDEDVYTTVVIKKMDFMKSIYDKQ